MTVTTDLGPAERLAQGRVIAVETMKAGVKRGISVEHALDWCIARRLLRDPQAIAATRLRNDFDTAQSGGIAAPQYDGMPPPESYTSRTVPERIVQARTNVRKALAAMPCQVETVLVHFVCKGLPARELCRVQNVDEKDAMARVRFALDCLADYYGRDGR